MSNRVVFIHPLNNFSNSSRTLSQVMEGMLEKGYQLDLYTSHYNTGGFLSGIPVSNSHAAFFVKPPFKSLTFFYWLWSQIGLFFSLWRYRKKEVVLYVNTLFPLGAALAGKLMGKKVIYHLHEITIRPIFFHRLLIRISSWLATDAIYPSQYAQYLEELPNVRCHTVYNGLSDRFIQRASQGLPFKKRSFNVLMVCPPLESKGINEFVMLARLNPQFQFELVLDTRKQSCRRLFENYDLPVNFKWFYRQNSLHPFYQKASLVINLSHPDQCIEMHGGAVLEGMNYGLPSIVPTVGGIAEMVEDGFNGYKINVGELKKISDLIQRLYEEPRLYRTLAYNAKLKAAELAKSKMTSRLPEIIGT